MCLDAGVDLLGVLVGQEHASVDFIIKEQANPYGVDVNSGCKDETGRKNAEKVKKFVEFAKKTG